MIENKPIRIAQIMGKWVGGGVEAVVMNYYRHIDRNKIQFDFICDEDSTCIPYEEIEKLGGKVILIPPYQKVFKYHKELKRVLKEGKYKIVHSHINTLSVFSLFAAKCAGVPVRIAHSHSTTNKKEKKKHLMKKIFKFFSKLFATDYMACTEHAGRWMFGNKEFNEGNVYILNNAIELNKYEYNEKIRIKKRKELNIDANTLVIGHVGRFVEQKNHKFLIDIFNELHKKNKNSILMLVGQGPLVQKMKEKVKKLNIEDSVLFLGQRKDVNELYQAMDIFLFPSLYEGLGMTVIEAQCSGLTCIASTEVPPIVKVTDKLIFVSLNKNIASWISCIKTIKKRSTCNYVKEIAKKGFDINIEVIKLEKYYIERIKQRPEKIAIISGGFLPIPATKGGAVENLVVNLLNENEKKQKIQFEIISIYDKEAIIESKKYKYSSFIFIKVNSIIELLDKSIFFVAKNILMKKNSISYRYILQRLSYLRKCSKIIKKNNYDKILLENHPTEYFALKWKKNYLKYKNRYYYHCHNEFPNTYGCKAIINKTHKIICVSDFRKNNVKDYLNMEEKKFFVLKNGIDTKIFQKDLSNNEKKNLKEKYNIGNNDKILLYTGRIIPEKGIKEIILALKQLNNKNIKLLIVGSSLNMLKAKTRFEMEIESIIDENIIFTGYVDYNQIYQFYKLADIGVFPSILEDSAPLTIIEALVSGLPIISTNSGGIPEYAINGSAILLKRDEKMVENLAKTIDELLYNENKLKEMSNIAKNVSKNLTKEKFYEDFCKQILD